MALGVLNNLSAIYAENNLNNTNASLQTVLEQLSSGSRINSGADDAAGLSLVNGLEANQSALTQSETNATEGVGLLQVADGALSQVTSLLDRAITLATEASNGTLNTTQEGAANQEYQSILSEVNNIGQTTTYNQEQVFDGSKVAIYTGDSSAAGSSVDQLYIRQLSEASVGDSGGAMAYSSGSNSVFLNLSGAQNAQATDTLNTSGTTTINVNYLVKGADNSENNATTQVTVGAGTSYSNTANGLISAINNAGLGLTASFTTQTAAGVEGGGSKTGIQISGGLVSVGEDPSSVSTSGEVDLSGVQTNELLTQGQSIVLQTGTNAAVTIAMASNIDSLATLATAIDVQDSDVSATVITNGDGTQSLALADKSPGAGALSVSISSATASPIVMSFASGQTGATGGYASGTLGFGNSVTSNSSEIVAGSIVMSNSATPGANAITFVMGAGPASGNSAGSAAGSIFTVNGNTLGALSTALVAELGVHSTITSSGISITSATSGTTLEAVGASSLMATPAVAQTSNVAGIAATNGTDGSTTLTMSGNASVGFVATDSLTGSIVLTNGTADTPGTPVTIAMGLGGVNSWNGANDTLTTGLSVVSNGATGLLDAINAFTADTGFTAALNGSGQIVLTSTTVGTTIAVSGGAINNTLQDTSNVLNVTSHASAPSAAAASTGATVATGVSEIDGNPIIANGNDTLSGVVVLDNATNVYTFAMGGGGAAGSATLTAGTYVVGGSTLSDLQQAIHSIDGLSTINAAVNANDNGLTFSSTVNGISISVNSAGLTDISALSFTTPASGNTSEFQSGVVALTDGGQLPGSGGSLSGSVTITNNGVTDTFTMGGASQVLAADGGTVTVLGNTLNALIAAVNDESAKAGSNLDLSASQDGSTNGLFLQSTAPGSTGLAANTSALIDTLAEASTNGTNGIAGATTIPANLVYSNGGTNASGDPIAGDIILTNSALGGQVTFAVGTGVAANTVYTGSSAADETLLGMANAINSVSVLYDVTATIGAGGLTVTSLDPVSTLTDGAGALNDVYSALQSSQVVGADPAPATFATATVGTSGNIGATDTLSQSIVLTNTYGVTTVTDTFTMSAAASTLAANSYATGGYTLQDLATAIDQASLADGLDLDATVANGSLDLQSTQSGGAITVGNGSNLYDTLSVVDSAPSSGIAGAKSSAVINLAGAQTTASNTDTVSGSITLTGSNGTDVFTMGGSSSAGTIAVGSGSGGETLGALATAITGSGIGINAIVTSSGLQLEMATDGSTAITAGLSTLRDTTPTAALSYTPSNPYNIGVYNSTGANSLYDSSTGQTPTTSNVNFASDSTGLAGLATISYSDGAGEALNTTDLTDQIDAQSALNDLNQAISDVAAQDGYIGAQINTLNSISQVMSTQQENVVSAQNAIQATDYASATSNMSKYEILSQTGIAALAQANSVQQEVTKLLQ